MTSKHAKRAVSVRINLSKHNYTFLQLQAVESQPQSRASTASRISAHITTDFTTGADEVDAMDQENLGNHQFQSVGKRLSSVWEHMRKQDNDKASCNICGALLSRKNGGTTGLRKHLHQVHALNRYSTSSMVKASRTIKFPSDRKSKLDALAVECVIEDGRSFGDLRRPGLLRIFNQLAPGRDIRSEDLINLFLLA